MYSGMVVVGQCVSRRSCVDAGGECQHAGASGATAEESATPSQRHHLSRFTEDSQSTAEGMARQLGPVQLSRHMC